MVITGSNKLGVRDNLDDMDYSDRIGWHTFPLIFSTHKTVLQSPSELLDRKGTVYLSCIQYITGVK
jgi:hypothetical protein